MKIASPLLALALVAGCSSSSSPGAAPDGSSPQGTDAAIEAAADTGGPGGPDGSAGSDGGPAHDGGSGGDAAPDAGFMEATHTPFPQFTSAGGPSMTAPELVTVSYAGDGNGATMSLFGDWIVGSSWLMTVGKDYGIQAGMHVKNVVLPGPAPTSVSDLDVQSMLETNLGNGTLPSSGAADAGGADAGFSQSIYLVLYPSTTTTGSFLDGPSTCTYEGGSSFIGGYHWETQSGAYHVAYAVIPTCTQGSLVEAASDLEISASHEFMEAATDPFPYTNPGYILPETDPWSFTDGEVADVCEGQSTVESGFSAQLIWSNTAAMGTGSPCVPAPPGPFFDTAPSTSQIVTIAAGQSTTLTLTGFSSAPVMPWSIDTFVGYSSFTPTVTLGGSAMNNGQTTTLSIAVPAGTPSQSYASVYIDSYRGAPTSFVFWPVGVVVP